MIFYSNYRPALWSQSASITKWYRCAYACADVIFITNDDHFGVFGSCEPDELVVFYQAYSHALCVIKQGASDTLVLNQSAVTAYPVKMVKHPVDTTAAGDAFAAGFLAEYLQQQILSTAVNTAQQLAAQVICSAGAIVKTTVQTASAVGEKS